MHTLLPLSTEIQWIRDTNRNLRFRRLEGTSYPSPTLDTTNCHWTRPQTRIERFRRGRVAQPLIWNFATRALDWLSTRG